MITNPGDDFYERVTSRIFKVMLAIAGAGTLAALAWRGWSVGAGFALGAAISWISFRWLKHAVDSLSAKRAQRAPRPRLAVLAGFRYLILGGAAYAILRYSSISLRATLAGLFVSVTAVIVEIFFEVVYGN
ncbi:MAG: ATP synthase subunit I [Bryobacteraceae bacterium]